MESTEIPSNPSNQNDWNRSSSRSGWGLSGRLLLAGLFLLAILAAGAYSLSSPAIRQALSIGKPPTSKYMTETVKRAPFRIAVTERGTLDSLKSATLASQVEGTTTIISLVPEGTLVEKGEVVCELDSSQLIQEEKEQQIAVTTAEADLKKPLRAPNPPRFPNDWPSSATKARTTSKPIASPSPRRRSSGTSPSTS